MKNDEPEVFQHYRVLRRPDDGQLWVLGRGAMGVTYKAVDTRLHVTVCLKIIHERLLLEEHARERFLREARAAASLRHRNVASVFHLGEYGNNYFYVMEFVEGETLEALVDRNGPLSVIDALAIVLQVSRALMSGYSKKLVHRDIKPSNVMLANEVDEEAVVKLIDFGLAKSAVEAGASLSDVNTSGFLGTPRYASPEQCDERPLDIRSDIYSLGATLWFLLTGEPPFTGSIGQVFAQHLGKPPPLEKLPGHIPDSVRALLDRMLAKSPADRQATPAVLRREIEACLREAPASGLVVPLSGLETRPSPKDGSTTTAPTDGTHSASPEMDDGSLPLPPRSVMEAPLTEAFASALALAGEDAADPSDSADESAGPVAVEPTVTLPPVASPEEGSEDETLPRPGETSGTTLPPRAASADTSTGASLQERYRLHRFLGEDEIGRLFLAESTTDKREWVTARIFHTEIVESSPEAIPELQTAYARLQSSPHPNVLELRDLGTAATPRFLISAASARDFSLLDILRQRGSLGTPEILHLARHAAAGVEHLHAHSSGALDLSPRSLLVRLQTGAASASFPDPADSRLLSEPVDQWSDFSLKLDPLPTILPARWREAGSASTWHGTRMLGSSRAASAVSRRNQARAMALLLYELAAGALPSGLADPAERRGHFPALPRLSDSANELLQRALADQLASVSATDFCEEFASAQDESIHAAVPVAAWPEAPAPLPDAAPEPEDDGIEEASLIDTPEISALVPELAGHADEDVPVLAPPEKEPAPVVAPLPSPAPVPKLDVAPPRVVAPAAGRARRSPLVYAGAGVMFLMTVVIAGMMTRPRVNRPAAVADHRVEPPRPVVAPPVAPVIVPPNPPPPVPAVQIPAPEPLVAQEPATPTPEATAAPESAAAAPAAEPTATPQTAASHPSPTPNFPQVVDEPPRPARETASRDSTPKPARQTQPEATHTHPHAEPTYTTQRQKASEPATTISAPRHTAPAPVTTHNPSSESQTRKVDMWRGSAPGG